MFKALIMLLNGFAEAIKIKQLMTMTVVDVDFLAPVDFKHVKWLKKEI